MPDLPLDYPEPFAATLGVMLYPGVDNDDPPRARAFAAGWLAGPLQRFHDAGYKLSYDTVVQIATEAGFEFHDLDERWAAGTATGELFKVLWALFNTRRSLTSWNNAIRIAEANARPRARSGRSAQWEDRTRFLSVAHLWAAWMIREGQFTTDPNVEYDGLDDFQSFLAEAEILRDFGQTWRPSRARSKPFLPADVWRVPDGWRPPDRRPGWPETGKVPIMTLSDDLMARLKPAGRPPKRR